MHVGRAYTAEFIGTFALCFIGAGAICADALTGGKSGLVGIALAHGLVLSILITALANVSGAHFNPAVTFGFLVTGRIAPSRAVGYWISQLAGAVLAGLFITAAFSQEVRQAVSGGTPVPAPGVSFGKTIWIEALLTFFLVFAVFGTAVDARAPRIGGFGIGLTVAFDILMGGPLTGASMNPARTFGPGLAAGVWDAHLAYWIGPLLGGGVAAVLYQALFLPRESTP